MIYAIWLRGVGFLRGSDVFVFDYVETAEAVRRFYGRKARVMPIDDPKSTEARQALLELEKALLQQEKERPRWVG